MGRRRNRQKTIESHEFKQHPRRVQRFDPARETAATDGKTIGSGRFEMDLLKPCPPEKLPNRRYLLAALVHHEVPVPNGPAARPAEHGQTFDQAGNIIMAQVAEKTGKQNKIRRHRAGIIAHPGGVGFEEAKLPLQTGLFRRRPLPRDGFRVIVKEPGGHIVSPGVIEQGANQVPAIPGTDADNPDRTGWAIIEGRGNLLADNPPPRLQARKTVILFIPLVPIHVILLR